MSIENNLMKLSGQQNYEVVIKERVANLKLQFIDFSSKFDRKLLFDHRIVSL